MKKSFQMNKSPVGQVFEKNKTNFRENRKLAWLVFAVVFALTVIVGGGGALRKEREAVLDVFHYGVHADNLSIFSDLQARVDCTENLVIVSARYTAIDDESVQAAKSAAAALENARDRDIASMVKQNNELNTAVESLYTELTNTTLSESDGLFALAQYKEFTSRGLTIARDGYNAQADAYNYRLTVFPASLVAAVSGVRQLPLFR